MKDKHGRMDNRAQVIRGLDKLRMAHLLNDMRENPGKYPEGVDAWLEWLNQESGDSIFEL